MLVLSYAFAFIITTSALPSISTTTVENKKHEQAHEKLKLVIDTDGVVDDVRAISIALSHPNVEVVAFTTVHGCVSVDQAVANVFRAQKANGINVTNAKIPIYKGAAFPILKNELVNETFFFGADGLSGRGDVEPKPQFAPSALVELSRKHQNLTIVSLGPLTNIALALKMDPDFGKRIRQLVAMGGSYLGIGNVNTRSTAESNFNGDPEAVEIVLREMEARIVIVPWEMYFIQGAMFSNHLNFTSHMDYKTRLARFLRAISSRPLQVSTSKNEQYMHADEAAISVAIDERNVMTRSLQMRGSMELAGELTRGQLALDWKSVSLLSNGTVVESLKLKDLRRPFILVTGYNATIVDDFLHRAVRESEKL